MDQNQQQAQTVNNQGAGPRPANGNNDGNGEKKVGPIIATLVIVLILIIAALYIFASRVNQPTIPSDQTAGQVRPVQAVTSTSTDVQSLRNDLNSATKGLDSQNF